MSACHWCCHHFESDPIRLPVRRNKKGAMEFGSAVYCSIDCCRASAMRTRGTPSLSLLRCLWRELDPITCNASPILPTAPPFEALEVFGGHLSIEQFREGAVTFPNPRVARGTVTRLMIPHETAQVLQFTTEPMYHMSRPSSKAMGKWLQS